MAGSILGKASAIYDGKFAAMSRSYGPEARGGACSSQVLISDEPITYPYVTRADYLLALSQEACTLFLPHLAEGGRLLYEMELVTPSALPFSYEAHGIPCTRMAEELGNRLVLNIVMIGFLLKHCPAISREAMEKAISSTVPKKFIDLNLKAFNQGYEYVVSPAESICK